MMYAKARTGQRILAAIIDFVIFIGIIELVLVILRNVLNYPEIPQGYYDVITSGDLTTMQEYLKGAEYNAFIEAANKSGYSTISIIFEIFFFAAYFLIIPLFWKKQTIGRLCCKIKVNMENGDAPTFGTLLLREFVGVLLVGILNCCCFIPLIVNIVALCKGNNPIHDRISATTMVSTVNIIQDDSDKTTTQKDNADIDVFIEE